MASQLIDSMTTSWVPEDYRDTYADRVQDLIDVKKAGWEVAATEAAPAPTNVVDLLDVLRRSVDAAQQRRKAGGTPSERPRSKATAAHRTAPGQPRRGPQAVVDVATPTKTALAALARQLHIAGRSTMTRDQLEKALSAAQGRRKGA